MYIYDPLPIPGGATAATAAFMNERSDATGRVQTTEGSRVVIWRDGEAEVLSRFISVFGIDDVGRIIVHEPGASDAVVVFDGEVLYAISCPAYPAPFVMAVNGAGVVVAICPHPVDGPSVWRFIAGQPERVIAGTSADINDASTVVGRVYFEGGVPYGDRPPNFLFENGAIQLFGAYPQVADLIGNDGFIVGHSFVSGELLQWTGDDVDPIDLPHGAESARVYDAQSRELFVGRSVFTDARNGSQTERATLWYRGEPIDLNDVTSGADGTVLSYAAAVNSHAHILVMGQPSCVCPQEPALLTRIESLRALPVVLACLAGPSASPDQTCGLFDRNLDERVDLRDIRLFLSNFR